MTKNWYEDTMAWVARIPQEVDSKVGMEPLYYWKVFEADTWCAARDAAFDAAFDAAHPAAHPAAYAARDAAFDAAHAAARDAAHAAAYAAARDAAYAAARDAAFDAAHPAAHPAAYAAAYAAARDAAFDAARDAALLARIKICAGINIDKKHIEHAEERWEANKRGYRVLCDVDGVLYVYCKIPAAIGKEEENE